MTYIAILLVMFAGQTQPSKVIISGLPSEEACGITVIAISKGLWATEHALVVDQKCKQGEPA